LYAGSMHSVFQITEVGDDFLPIATDQSAARL
jgi:hypothetical protein